MAETGRAIRASVKANAEELPVVNSETGNIKTSYINDWIT